MTSMEKKLKAQQVRRNWFKQRAERNAGKAVIGVPTIVDAIPGDADGLMPVTRLEDDLKIQIPDWREGNPPPFGEEQLVFEWRFGNEAYTELSDEKFPLPISDTFPLDRVIEKHFFTGREGTFSFRYGVKAWSDTSLVFSAPVPITLDRTPPYGNAEPPAIEPLTLPITDASMAADGGVFVTIPDFVEDKKEFVLVVIGWLDHVPLPDEPLVADVTELLPTDRKILVPRDAVERYASGDHYVAYVLFDKAKNKSRLSFPYTVPVALGPLPTLLKPPVVPLAEDDGLIDLMDAYAGVEVEVPAYDNWQSTDKIVVKWGNSALEPVPVGEKPPFPNPMSIPVIWQHLKDEYTVPAGEQTIHVSYSVMRGTTPYPEPVGVDVEVDFSSTGPTNPDEPNPVNPDLDPVIVRGDSGTDNHLLPADAGKPATATLTLYDPPTEDDLITLYWNGVAVADTYTVLDTDKAGDDIELDVLWSEIEAGGGPAAQVYYTLSHPDFVNDQRSPVTDVTVDAIPLVIEAPEYVDLSDVGGGNLILNCQSLRLIGGVIGYRVHIPASDYLVDGQTVIIKWQLEESDGTLVTSAEKTQTLPITADAKTKGIDWFVAPYATHILPAYTGTADKWAYAKTTYTLTIKGQPVPSETSSAIVGIGDLGSGIDTCDLSNIVPAP
jgi:hypothetical protein